MQDTGSPGLSLGTRDLTELICMFKTLFHPPGLLLKTQEWKWRYRIFLWKWMSFVRNESISIMYFPTAVVNSHGFTGCSGCISPPGGSISAPSSSSIQNLPCRWIPHPSTNHWGSFPPQDGGSVSWCSHCPGERLRASCKNISLN